MTCPFLCPWEQRVPQLLLALGGLLYLLRPCPPQPQSLRGRASLEWVALQLPLPLGLSWGGQRPLWGPCLCARRQPPAQGPGPAAARGREQSHVCFCAGRSSGTSTGLPGARPTLLSPRPPYGRSAKVAARQRGGSGSQDPRGAGARETLPGRDTQARGAVHTGHGPRRPRTWGQGEPRAGPGGS